MMRSSWAAVDNAVEDRAAPRAAAGVAAAEVAADLVAAVHPAVAAASGAVPALAAGEPDEVPAGALPRPSRSRLPCARAATPSRDTRMA